MLKAPELFSLLACDTANGLCSVALHRSGHDIVSVKGKAQSEQAETLFAMLDEVFATTGLHYHDLTHLAVSIGPGSFTGIRIGLAAMRGIALVTGLPILGVSTLEALAADAIRLYSPEQPIIVALDARRGQIYHQVFSPTLEKLSDAQLLTYDEARQAYPLAQALLVGNGASLLVADNTGNLGVPDAESIARLAEQYLPFPTDTVAPAPFYIRPPDAKVSSRISRAGQ